MEVWRRVACWISKTTRAQSHASAREPIPTLPFPPPHTRTTSQHSRARTHAHTQKYVILIAFLLQQLFREHALMLRYTNMDSLVRFKMDRTAF